MIITKLIKISHLLHSIGHVNGVNVIGLSLQGPSVPGLAVMKPANAQAGNNLNCILYPISKSDSF